MIQRVDLKTDDGVAIIGDYYPAVATSEKGLLLVHMMPATRASWRAFAAKASAAEYHILAIDLRGHGESEGGPDGYTHFSDGEHQASRVDIDAGVRFLESKGVTELSLGGASIGANLALQYLAERPNVRAAFLLSPGLEYRGVKTESAATALHQGQRIYLVASDDDPYSVETVKTLFGRVAAGVEKKSKLFQTAGHGTTIFEREPQCMGDIVSWLAAMR